MTKRVFFLVLMLTLFFQILFSNYFRVGNVAVDFFLITTIYAGIFFGRSTGVWVGLICGIMADHYSCVFVGTHILSKLLAGFLAGVSYRRIDSGSVVFRVFLIGGLSLLDGLLVCSILRLSGFTFFFGKTISDIILPQTFLNICIGTPFITFVLLRLQTWGNISNKSQGYSLDHLF